MGGKLAGSKGDDSKFWLIWANLVSFCVYRRSPAVAKFLGAIVDWLDYKSPLSLTKPYASLLFLATSALEVSTIVFSRFRSSTLVHLSVKNRSMRCRPGERLIEIRRVDRDLEGS